MKWMCKACRKDDTILVASCHFQATFLKTTFLMTKSWHKNVIQRPVVLFILKYCVRLVGYRSGGNCVNSWDGSDLGLPPACGLPTHGFPSKPDSYFHHHPPGLSVSILAQDHLKPSVSLCLFFGVRFLSYGRLLLPLWTGLWEGELWDPSGELHGEVVKGARE